MLLATGLIGLMFQTIINSSSRTTSMYSNMLLQPQVNQLGKSVTSPPNVFRPNIHRIANTTSRSEQVLPSSYYWAEPAPMGIADYGINTNTNTSYSYNTTSFLGTAAIGSLTSSGGTYSGQAGIQMNVELKYMVGSTLYVYWLQNVVQIVDNTKRYQFLDNIWNFTLDSSSPSLMSASGVSGSGQIGSSSPDTYYYYQPTAHYNLVYPSTVQFEINATLPSTHPVVTFSYNVGSGWVTYDTVTFCRERALLWIPILLWMVHNMPLSVSFMMQNLI